MADPADDTVIDDDFLRVMGNVDMAYVWRMIEIERNRPPEFHSSDTSDEFEDYFDDDPIAESVVEDMANVTEQDYYIIEQRRIQEENRVQLAALEEEERETNSAWLRYKKMFLKAVNSVQIAVGAVAILHVEFSVAQYLARAAKRYFVVEFRMYLR